MANGEGLLTACGGGVARAVVGFLSFAGFIQGGGCKCNWDDFLFFFVFFIEFWN